MNRVLIEEKIKCVILTSRNSFFEKCIIAAAYKQGIPLIIVQHGMGVGTSNPELFPGMKMAVFGKTYQQKLLQWGMSEKDIVITGPIIFENIHTFVKEKKTTNTILLITAPYIEENYFTKEEYFAKVRIILEQLQRLGKKIVIKLHPMEKYATDYITLAQRNNWKNITVIQEHGSELLYRLISDSDLVVNSYSTVALEAMILEKPILTINMGPNFVPEISDSIFAGGIHVTMNDNITKAAQEVLEDSSTWKEKRHNVVQQFCYKVDGKATERLVNLMYQMLKISRS